MATWSLEQPSAELSALLALVQSKARREGGRKGVRERRRRKKGRKRE